MSDDNTTTNATDKPVDEATVAKPTPKKKKKVKRSVPFGVVHIMSSFNNTVVTVTDQSGNTLTNSSAGACGFRGSKKGTAYAAQVAAEKAINGAKQQYGLSKANVLISGIGLGRESGVRALITASVGVEMIKDVTGLAHGGCRPKKARRV